MRVAGVDVGRRKDFTALCVVQWPNIVTLLQLPHVRFSEQAKILRPHLLPCSVVAVDGSGLGVGFVEQLEDAGVRPWSFVIGAGIAANTMGERRAFVGKEFLMFRIREAVAQGLTVSTSLPGAKELHSQMGLMFPKARRTGYRIEAASGHDDLVLALALALMGADIHASQASRH